MIFRPLARILWTTTVYVFFLIKCIRNNLIGEKCQQFSLDFLSTASFADVKELYNSERKYSNDCPLTQCAVNPSQLQNVQHVLQVFNYKVVASLKIKECQETANFIQKTILNWWNVMNVSKKGILVQNPQSTALQNFLVIFNQASSEHGHNRVQYLTHGTKKALIRTMHGMIVLFHICTKTPISIRTCQMWTVFYEKSSSEETCGNFVEPGHLQVNWQYFSKNDASPGQCTN